MLTSFTIKTLIISYFSVQKYFVKDFLGTTHCIWLKSSNALCLSMLYGGIHY